MTKQIRFVEVFLGRLGVLGAKERTYLALFMVEEDRFMEERIFKVSWPGSGS